MKSKDIKDGEFPSIYQFSETDLSTTFEEFKSILYSEDEPLFARDISQKWISLIETFVEDSNWIALWNRNDISKIVDVILIHPSSLEATIEVLDDSETIVDNELIVPLIELTPIQNQTKKFNIFTTAKILSQLKFFYKNIWKPWDENDEDSEDWIHEHLENRIALLTLCEKDETLIKFNRLSSEASFLTSEIQRLNEDEDENENEDEDDERIVERYRLCVREHVLRKEAEILENINLRLAAKRLEVRQKLCGRTENQIILHYVSNSKSEFSLGQVSEIMKEIHSEWGSHVPLKFYSEFQEALESCLPKDVIFLTPGRHELAFLSDCKNGGISLIGIGGSRDEILLLHDSFADKKSPLLEFEIGSEVLLRNLTIIGNEIGDVIYVEGSSLILNNVSIKGGDVGLSVEDVILSLNNVDISECRTALEVIGDKSNLSINHSIFRDGNKGMIVDYRTKSVTLSSLDLRNFKEFDVVIETENGSGESILGTGDLLDVYLPNFIKENCTLTGSVRIDFTSSS